MARNKLSASMTRREFDRGYWYATDLREFARHLAVPGAAKLRKDELETAIKHFLRTGKLVCPTGRSLTRSGRKDVELGLRLDLRVRLYTNDDETKGFLEQQAQKLSPGMRRKTGARYRLNRWREQQITKGRAITYADLVRHYVRLNRTEGPFERVPHVRYIYFLSDYLASEPGATHARAIAAWKQIKRLDLPKHYRSWRRWRAGSR